jgi:hypothetical protein
MHNIYYEKQTNGLCRKHSLNAYFGYAKISEPEFAKYQQEYDIEYAKKFNFTSTCSSFDIVASDQKNIVSYILKKNAMYTRYYAINQIFQKNVNECILEVLHGSFFFIYNESHIYGARLKNGKWYIVNSMGGVRLTNINKITHQKNIGFIVPVSIKLEFFHNISLIKSTIGQDLDLKNIKNFLIEKNDKSEILGNLEIPLSICMDIIDVQFQIHKNGLNESINEFNTLYEEVVKYNSFLSEFTKGRYNDIDLIFQYIPDIVLRLVMLSTSTQQTII